ncbi:MAG: hypothetical protein ISS25_03180 [Nanoarchaeota archaeon]|nr:hypothetical protein [DPANN group archaeon]MBL7116804.1 hypothetical protein [Nanoarchaeota archaeon]
MTLGDVVNEGLLEEIFDPRTGIMHSVAFASGSGTNFREAVLESQKEDSNFSIDLLITDKKKKKGEIIGALEYAEKFGVESFTLNGYKFCGSWIKAQETVEGRIAYEERTQAFNMELLKKIQDYESSNIINFDLAVLAGYMRLVKGALLRRFDRRAINVHPAALDIFNDNGTRKYIGENAVFDALSAGEERTRSSIILLDPETDAGSVLVSGSWVEYTGKRPVTQDEADEHQEKQKEESDWPALRFALSAIANGELEIHRTTFHHDGNPAIVYKGIEQPYQGVELPLENG